MMLAEAFAGRLLVAALLNGELAFLFWWWEEADRSQRQPVCVVNWGVHVSGSGGTCGQSIKR